MILSIMQLFMRKIHKNKIQTMTNSEIYSMRIVHERGGVEKNRLWKIGPERQDHRGSVLKYRQNMTSNLTIQNNVNHINYRLMSTLTNPDGWTAM